jgi:class 3 adenylate cyclase/tetratricopeptide (TPR) repeat protein
MSEVFISYGRSTAKQAQAAAAALRALGFAVWLDEDLPGHRDYADVIQEQLDEAKAVVVIWSDEAVKSQWVRSEANRGREKGKLVQLTIDRAPLPMPFDQVQCLNLAGWSGDDEHPGWARVVASVEELVRGKVRSPVRHGGRTTGAQGERRHLTVLACGLANVTAISATMDPEQWHDIFTRFRRQAMDAVRQMDGHVAQQQGDGFVAYFGYPEAREDAAECAVRAGLTVVEATGELNRALAQEHGVRLEVRIGIHAGTVVVAQGDGEQIGMFGDAPRTAAAIEADAGPDTVVMSDVVHELVSGLFVVTDAGAQARQGVDEPIRLFRVVRPALASGRARGFAPREGLPFVGREDELHILASRWRRVRDGEGQTVLLVGEPGIGKTRLIDEFRASLRTEPHLWIEAAGAPLFANTPFHAVARMLDQGLGGGGEEEAEARFARLEAALAPAGVKLAEAAPLIAELLGLAIPPSYAQPMIPPDQKRRRLLAALTGWVFSATTSQPLVIVIEDLQWVDPSTMELLQTLVDQGVTAPLLLIATARPEFRAPWPVRGHLAQVTLARLSDRQTRDLVSAVVSRAGMDAGAEDLIKRVVQRTDGVPLFAEELARLVAEGHGRMEGREIPVTLLDSLAARLDRLGPAREIAQLGSVIGREFSYELIAAVSAMPADDLDADLAALAEADLIYARGLPPEATYQFKHALMQDAAYDALLKSRRRDLHIKVARTIAERFPALAEAQPEVLARHWTEAGEAAPAVAAWKIAGDAAYGRRAYKEAESAYRQALAMLATTPEDPQRDATELTLASALNRVLQLTKGYAAPETVEAAGRARLLAEKSGAISELIREEGRIWQALITAGDYAGAAGLASHIIDLIHAEGDNPTRLAFASLAQVQTSFYTGDLAGVEEHFAVISPLLDNPDQNQAPGNNQISLGVASLAAWISGRADTARARIARARAFADQSRNPYDLGIWLHFSGSLHIWEEDPLAADAAASQLLKLADDGGLTYLADLARGTLGWARAHRGAVDEGVELMRRSCSGRVGAAVGLTFGLARLGECLAMAGKMDEALATLEEALSFNPQERVYRPAAITYRGELRLLRGELELAESDFREAVNLAQDMGARAWELRAILGLARMMQDRGETKSARDMAAAAVRAMPEPPGPAEAAQVAAIMPRQLR